MFYTTRMPVVFIKSKYYTINVVVFALCRACYLINYHAECYRQMFMSPCNVSSLIVLSCQSLCCSMSPLNVLLMPVMLP